MVDDRFLLLDTLGRGGMASVYRAFDRTAERVVVLKVQRASETAGPAHPLCAEFAAWARLRHPNIVEAYELGVARHGPVDAGTPYLVLEHVRGGPVHRVLRPGSVAPELVERLAVDVLRALEHVHSAGLVHRDLKPANLLLGRATGPGPRRIKLTDFGLAAPAGEADEPGRISGSLPYVAPEAILGRPVDGRADLYGLGIALYELATGGSPAGDTRPEAVLRWHLEGPPADPRRVHPRWPGRLARFVARLTERDPTRRPDSAAEALALLGATARGRGRIELSAAARGARARMRLALDATRLGARRVLELPDDPGERESLVGQIRAAAQIHGLGFHDLGLGLEHVVLRLLVEQADAATLVRRFALDRWLPLVVVGGVAVRDRTGRPPVASAEGGRAITRFVGLCAERRPVVLLASPAPGPLGAVVLAALRRAAASPARPPGPGGWLLLVAARAH